MDIHSAKVLNVRHLPKALGAGSSVTSVTRGRPTIREEWSLELGEYVNVIHITRFHTAVAVAVGGRSLSPRAPITESNGFAGPHP
jgi:hypothetical protein